MKKFRWPRGKYNGQRIVGVRILFRINVLCWHRPAWEEGIILIGPFIWNYEANYHFMDRT